MFGIHHEKAQRGQASLHGLCLVLSWISLISAVVTPILTVMVAVWPQSFGGDDDLALNITAEMVAKTALWQRMGAMACDLVADGFLCVALVYLFRLFRRYAAGEVFTARACRLLDRMALWLLISQIADFLMGIPAVTFLSYTPRQITFGAGVDSEGFILLFAALCVLVVARVMHEAQRLAAENESFV